MAKKIILVKVLDRSAVFRKAVLFCFVFFVIEVAIQKPKVWKKKIEKRKDLTCI